ncbi:three prime repair exonuclease 2 [Sphaerodactylus townsendi]|uniref:three prime repair exonuclease 2 n=1 Tax=Sphaerodactylus townsendi TaxID=933632 RepID=UPI002026C535|nr:three prime repair exonuclease 2 [Sphaerodactylus townsendi]
MASPQEFQTFVFLDVETTGLPPAQPCIAELCLFAVNRHSLQCPALDLSQFPQPPRILDKLTLCIDPEKPFAPKAEEITGLSNQTLEENCKPHFNSAVVEAMRAFLDRQAGPICLVAHNGLGFDFPLLRTELWRVDADLPPDTSCLDTLPALKDLDQAANKSYRLGEVFRRFYGQDPVGAHSAEGDVLTLLLVFLAKAPSLMEWAAVNARSWGEIKPMYPPSPLSRRNWR